MRPDARGRGAVTRPAATRWRLAAWSAPARGLVQQAGLALLLVAGSSGAWLAWAQPVAGPHVDYRATGVVQALLPPPSDLHRTRPVIVIFHDPVPGLMPEAMSMPFIAASVDLFRGVRPGDRIAFGMQETADALLVVTIERLSPP